MPEYLCLIIGIAVVARRRPRRPRHDPRPRPAAARRRRPPAPDAAAEPRVGDDAETPRDTADPHGRGRRPARRPTPPSRPLETPESTAGRLVRLRQRLARSQSPLGRGLLALLSRDVIDEDTWEEIEDTLITADVGVAPTQELVARLRTRVKVEGSRSASVRDILREELVTLVDPSAGPVAGRGPARRQARPSC